MLPFGKLFMPCIDVIVAFAMIEYSPRGFVNHKQFGNVEDISSLFMQERGCVSEHESVECTYQTPRGELVNEPLLASTDPLWRKLNYRLWESNKVCYPTIRFNGLRWLDLLSAPRRTGGASWSYTHCGQHLWDGETPGAKVGRDRQSRMCEPSLRGGSRNELLHC